MSTINGGDVAQLKIGGRELDVMSESSFELTLSGKENSFKPTGNGKMRGTQKRVLAAVDGLEVAIDSENEDHEYLQGIRDDGEPVAFSLTLNDGTTYSGSMGIEGELKYKTDTGSASFAMRGPKLEQI